jgi:hypothetical protein
LRTEEVFLTTTFRKNQPFIWFSDSEVVNDLYNTPGFSFIKIIYLKFDIKLLSFTAFLYYHFTIKSFSSKLIYCLRCIFEWINKIPISFPKINIYFWHLILSISSKAESLLL